MTTQPDLAPAGTNQTLQAMVDAAAARGGGRVVPPPGLYDMHDALHLRSGVTLAAEGRVVLRKVPSVCSRLKHYVGYGHYELAVQEPEKFRPGMGVHIQDDRSVGFYNTSATIVAQQGEWFFLSRMANHDYLPGHNALVTSLFSLIEGEGVENAAVEGVELDGNVAETTALNGCRGGAVFLIRCRGVRLQRLHITHFKGEGISFQQSADVVIRDCDIHDCTGNGLHPGSGLVRYVMENNHAHHNGACGLFYCLRTTHAICRGNRLEHNGKAGISVGERDTDHLIENNVIQHNGDAGILFRRAITIGGERTLVLGNTLAGNATRNPAAAELVVEAGLRDVHVAGNTFAPLEGRPALRVGEACRAISIVGNTVNGRAQQPGDAIVSGSDVSWTQPATLPPVGPAALPLDGARHLNWPTLPPWREPGR